MELRSASKLNSMERLEQIPFLAQVDTSGKEPQHSSLSLSRSPFWKRYYRYLWRAIIFVLPSFLVRGSSDLRKDQARNFPTVYLDGLRGLFSFLVYVRHFLLPWERSLDTGYAQQGSGSDSNRHLVKLPFIRLVYSGPTILIFFLVSGFVLAYKPLKLIRKGDYNALIRAMVSSVFRRALRLFLPPVTSTFWVAIAVYFGLYKTRYEMMPGVMPRHPERFDSILLQLKDWGRFVLADLTHPWSWKSPKSEYDTHLWTIPIQFRSSMIVFLILIGLARTSSRSRMILILTLWLYSIQQGRWELVSFLAGIFLAERSIEKLEGGRDSMLPTHTPGVSPTSRMLAGFCKKLFWRVLFMLGFYVCSFPRQKEAGPLTPGFVWMSTLTTSYRMWCSFGTTMIVWAMISDSLLQGFFKSSVLRYMAKISFSLYLVHGPVLHLFGYSFVPTFMSLIGGNENGRYQLGVLLAFIALTPVMLWIADVFWRLVDQPCATFILRFENFCFAKDV
jgi:peptidoglycan/LPS O-acetylase OafA/YrhL